MNHNIEQTFNYTIDFSKDPISKDIFGFESEKNICKADKSLVEKVN